MKGRTTKVAIPRQVSECLLRGTMNGHATKVAIPLEVSECLLSGMLYSMHGIVRPGNAFTCGSYQPAFSTGESRPEPTQVVKPLELF